MRKLLFNLSRALLFALLLSSCCLAQAMVIEVDGLYYNTISNSTVEVTYPSSLNSSNAYRGNISIPQEITFNGITYSVVSIGNNAFKSSELTGITIPNSIKSIGQYAFCESIGLEGVNIPNSVITIGKSAFQNCTGMNELKIGSSVTSIGELAFANCLSLKDVTIPDAVTQIGIRAFQACRGMTSLSIGNSVKVIEGWAFEWCDSLTDVTIPNSVTAIGYGAFQSCPNLSRVTIGNSLTAISEITFNGCTALTEVKIGDSVQSIKIRAFQGCTALTEITIPNAVTTIAQDAFSGCTGLKKIYFNAENCTYCEAFQKCPMIESVIFGDNVKIIPDGFCRNITELTEVTIPNSVTSIGKSAFNGCTGLKSIYLPNSVTSIGAFAFSGCSGLTSLHLGDSVKTINDEAFSYCSSLANINAISASTIGNKAFLGCKSLTRLVLSDSVISIGEEAFYGTDGLLSLSIGNSVKTIGLYAFGISNSNNNNLSRVDISDLDAWCDIVFSDNSSNPLARAHHLYLNNEEITELIIPTSVTSIGNYAFYGCSITKVTIPNSVVSIESSAFSHCTELVRVTIGDSVKTIGMECFAYCSNLLRVTMGKSIEEVQRGAFWSCKNLSRVDIKDLGAWCGIVFGDDASNPISLAHRLFLNGSEITDLVIPNTVTKIQNKAFLNCQNFESITIPNSVIEIGGWAFSGCSGVTKVNLGNSVRTVGKSPFLNCRYLDTININDLDAWCRIMWAGFASDYVADEPWYHLLLNGIEIQNLVIPNTITKINDRAFYHCKGFKSITIPNSVTHIGTSAFYMWCEDLTSIYIPSSVISCEGGFSYGIDSVHISDLEAWCKISFSSELSNPCSGRSVRIGHKPPQLFINGVPLIDLVIPNTITTIGSYTFNSFVSLNSVVVPESVTLIEHRAFQGCKSLTSVTCEGTTPPIDYENSFDNVTYSNAVLHIPETAVEAYDNEACWFMFQNIELFPVVTCLGDIDGDGRVSIEDVTTVISYLLTNNAFGINTTNADVDGNGRVNIDDVTTLIQMLLKGGH